MPFLDSDNKKRWFLELTMADGTTSNDPRVVENNKQYTEPNRKYKENAKREVYQ